ncbi:MAG: polymer-forming cytoskeletal protein [Planctomycetota bacterium]
MRRNLLSSYAIRPVCPSRRSRARRGASLYLMVMGVAMMVAAMALTTSELARVDLAASRGTQESFRAEMTARSGAEYALNWLNRTPDWRTDLTNDIDTGWHRTWSGRFRFRVTDVDGDLADDRRDHGMLRVEANVDDSYSYLEVDIEPAARGLTCLECAVFGETGVTVGNGGRVAGDGIVGSNDDIQVTGGDIDLDASASGKCLGNAYNANETEDVSYREVPGEHVLDWYLKFGTEIPLSSVPNSFGQRRLDLKMMSRWFNDLGDINPHGVYWIDLAGESADLKWCRTLGTLVLLNAGAGTEFSDVAIMQASPLNYPSLIVQGDLKIDMRSFITQQELREQWIFNYNPPGMPYEGVEDNDKNDNRPATLDGIVYVTGTVTVEDDSIIRGSLIANNVVVNGGETLTANHRPYAFYYPPPGFSAGSGARALPYSWRRVPQ